MGCAECSGRTVALISQDQEFRSIDYNKNLISIYIYLNGGCTNSDSDSEPRGKVPMRPALVVQDPNGGPQRRLQRIIPGGPDACIDSTLASSYINQPEVISAIHVKATDHCWSVCATQPGWSYNSTRTNLPRDTYPYLIANIRVVVYNGDWDACVPYTDGELWTSGMGLPVKKAWHAWKYTSLNGNTNQVAGYATEYDVSQLGTKGSFDFVTIKGGRHEAPETAPAQSLEMVQRLIDGNGF